MEEVILWLEQYMMPCLNKMWFGIPCPGCGFQRALILVLRGEIADGLLQYPPLPFMGMLLPVLGFHLAKGNARSLLLLKALYFLTVTTILLNYINNLILH